MSERARALRDAGASDVATFEGQHDVFAPLTLAATVGGLDLMTNVAIAFSRNPIRLAHQANDHQLLSGDAHHCRVRYAEGDRRPYPRSCRRRLRHRVPLSAVTHWAEDLSAMVDELRGKA